MSPTSHSRTLRVPGLFKFDKVSYRNRFKPILAFLNQIQSSKNEISIKIFWAKKLKKPFFRFFFVEFFAFDGSYC